MEKTKLAYLQKRGYQKHLHGRGEDQACIIEKNEVLETPPRTWRRRQTDRIRRLYFGNTSTDVEKTGAVMLLRSVSRKHLHGRGEDSQWFSKNQQALVGNTSTDVEKTSAGDTGLWHFEKHLHGRGEDLPSFFFMRALMETPPRTWRRQQDLALSHFS